MTSPDPIRLRRGAAAALLLAAPLGACGRLRPPPPAPAAAPAPPPAPAWSWSAWPSADLLPLAETQALLRPRRSAALPGAGEGWLYVLGGERVREVEAGQLLAFGLDETRGLGEEAERLKQAGLALDRRDRALRREEAREALAHEEQRVAEQLRLLRRAKELQADPAVLEGLLPAGVDPARIDAAIAEAEAGLQRARERLARAEQLDGEQQALAADQLENEQAKAAFERRLWDDRAALTAPFAGRLTRAGELLPLPAGSQVRGPGGETPAGRLRAGGDAGLGLLEDLSELHAVAEIADGRFLAKPADSLVLTFEAAGRPVRAAFAGREPDAAGKSAPQYRFVVPEADRAALLPLLGGRVEGALQVRLAEPARLVPKVALILHDAEAFRGGRFEAGVAACFPGARVLQVGRDAVAIVPPGGADGPSASAPSP